LLVALVLSITLSSESLLVRGDEPLAVWLYEHLPLHAMFASLLVGGFLLLQSQVQRADAQAQRHSGTDMVEVMTGTGRTQVRLTDIECLEAERNYINVHTPQRSYLLRQTLSSLEKSLCPREFLRVHRSVIVNRARIRERRQGGVLVLNSGRTVRVSRGFARRLN
jgi:DNA-binding LytR/AlgR family response regulator